MWLVVCLFEAQVVQEEQPVPVQGAISPEEYTLGPGDHLALVYTGNLNASVDAVVSVDGRLTVGIPVSQGFLGPASSPEEALYAVKPGGVLKAQGLSLAQAEDSVNRMLSRVYRGVRVSLLLVEPRWLTVPVLGAVRSPGPRTLYATSRLADFIRKAGGVAGGDLSRVEVWDGDSLVGRFNLYEYMTRGNLEQNPLLREDLRVVVPVAESTVVVRGYISPAPIFGSVEAGAVPAVRIAWQPGERVASALAKVGGLSQNADVGAVCIKRKGKIIPASMQAELLPGDELLVPGISKYVYVTGEVRAPGAKTYTPGLSVGDYISLAGGFTQRGKTKSFRLVASDGSVRTVGPDYIPGPGDRIEVGRVTFKWWEDYLSVASTVTAVFVTWLYFFRQ